VQRDTRYHRTGDGSALLFCSHRVIRTTTTTQRISARSGYPKRQRPSHRKASRPPATEAETEAEAEERRRKYEQECKEYEQEQEPRTEESRLEDERREKAWEVERARTEKLQKACTGKFDRILENAPAMYSPAQLKVFLRALVNLAP